VDALGQVGRQDRQVGGAEGPALGDQVAHTPPESNKEGKQTPVMSSDTGTYRGVLIEQSVTELQAILQHTKVVGERPALLESEDSRGTMRFLNVEVSEADLWTVLRDVAASIQKPGWYFHLVGDRRMYVVLPYTILFADEGDQEQLSAIIEYAVAQGIHRHQLDLANLFIAPYD
jgi:hypothetical protein